MPEIKVKVKARACPQVTQTKRLPRTHKKVTDTAAVGCHSTSLLHLSSLLILLIFFFSKEANRYQPPPSPHVDNFFGGSCIAFVFMHMRERVDMDYESDFVVGVWRMWPPRLLVSSHLHNAQDFSESGVRFS